MTRLRQKMTSYNIRLGDDLCRPEDSKRIKTVNPEFNLKLRDILREPVLKICLGGTWIMRDDIQVRYKIR